MNLDSVTVALRPRGNWESTDLGTRMIRRDAKLIYQVWFAFTLPLVIATAVLTWYTPYGGWALLAYWWFEPLTDGLILHVISQRLFGASPTVRGTLGQTLSLARRNWVFLLTPLRLHFARSTAMPLTQLEGLRGAARRARAKTINRRINNHGVGVTLAYQHLVLCVYFGIALLAFWLLPEAMQSEFWNNWWQVLDETNQSVIDVLTLGVIYTAQSLLHPWFVGAGFGLYINCRNRLEAWDIEVAFRRAAARRTGRPALAGLCVVGLGLGLISPVVEAQSSEADPTVITETWPVDQIEAAAKRAAESSASNTTETRYRYRSRRETSSDDAQDSAAESTSGSVWSTVVSIFATITEFGLWLVFLLFAAILFLTRDRWLPLLDLNQRGGLRRQKTRLIVSGEVVDSDALPDDVVGEARRLWYQKRHRSALSLLFRGAVINAVRRFELRLPDSATEGLCIRAVANRSDATYSADFRNITEQWLRCAYGGHVPDDQRFETLCNGTPFTSELPS
ncbi:MAG: hypothetical protein AAF265_10055 [Pseudomonadota bacterium]